MPLDVIVLAAGQGTRMKSSQPKVLFDLGGRPLLSWILDAVASTAPDRVAVVVGHEADRVRAVLPDGIIPVLQAEQLGTGHATALALDALGNNLGADVLVLPGDTPLLDAATLAALLATHRADGNAATLVTTHLDDPAGYGRVCRDGSRRVTAVIEDRDAGPEELAITEVNAAMYVFSSPGLRGLLDRLDPSNAQGEFYLTDVVGLLVAAGERVGAVAAPIADVRGINSMHDLAVAGRELRLRINRRWMDLGVWMLDPDRVYIDASVELTPGVRIYPGVHLEGATRVAAGAEIGPDVHARDAVVGEDASVRYAVLEGCKVGPNVQVGPYARLRPGTVLEAGSKAGTFVELKKARVGAGSKVPHLSYVGDADIGADSNIGAGSITCNWDGFEKHTTTIGDGVFIGSDTMLVAPVEVGDGAYTGAGSVITRNVSPDALAVERSQQKEITDYAARRRRRASNKGSEDS
jgi:bifunctional UDP-N-acetylglucosamine pyrophosphorylase/glucosamine-1-phosphate N-acetyltransferase